MTSQLPAPPAFGAPIPIAPSQEVLRFLALRRSASALSLRAPGPGPAQLSDLLTLAARVPDHGKLAPWRFVVLEGDDKATLVARLEALALARGDAPAAAKLGKLRTPPTGVVVVFRPRPGAIPEWEQMLSAGVACANLLYGAMAMGFGANWITDWYSYDPEASAIMGLATGERVAGVVLIGQTSEAPQERERPDISNLVSWWRA